MCNTKEGRGKPRLIMNSKKRLGIDIGSTTVKISIIDDAGNILFADYERHFANIQETLSALLKKGAGQLGNLDVEPMITGSGGLTLSKHQGSPSPPIWRFLLSRR